MKLFLPKKKQNCPPTVRNYFEPRGGVCHPLSPPREGVGCVARGDETGRNTEKIRFCEFPEAPNSDVICSLPFIPMPGPCLPEFTTEKIPSQTGTLLPQGKQAMSLPLRVVGHTPLVAVQLQDAPRPTDLGCMRPYRQSAHRVSCVVSEPRAGEGEHYLLDAFRLPQVPLISLSQAVARQLTMTPAPSFRCHKCPAHSLSPETNEDFFLLETSRASDLYVSVPVKSEGSLLSVPSRLVSSLPPPAPRSTSPPFVPPDFSRFLQQRLHFPLFKHYSGCKRPLNNWTPFSQIL